MPEGGDRAFLFFRTPSEDYLISVHFDALLLRLGFGDKPMLQDLVSETFLDHLSL